MIGIEVDALRAGYAEGLRDGRKRAEAAASTREAGLRSIGRRIVEQQYNGAVLPSLIAELSYQLSLSPTRIMDGSDDEFQPVDKPPLALAIENARLRAVAKRVVKCLETVPRSAPTRDDIESLAAVLAAAPDDGVPWPLMDSIRRVCEATTHLLRDHNCDCHGHEETKAALDALLRQMGVEK